MSTTEHAARRLADIQREQDIENLGHMYLLLGLISRDAGQRDAWAGQLALDAKEAVLKLRDYLMESK